MSSECSSNNLQTENETPFNQSRLKGKCFAINRFQQRNAEQMTRGFGRAIEKLQTRIRHWIGE